MLITKSLSLFRTRSAPENCAAHPEMRLPIRMQRPSSITSCREARTLPQTQKLCCWQSPNSGLPHGPAEPRSAMVKPHHGGPAFMIARCHPARLVYNRTSVLNALIQCV
uniref:Uncharacterized protein n=1 Tax=Syphacia muris TaxID=451379 RepID=A0A0N5AIU4_9BILA